MNKLDFLKEALLKTIQESVEIIEELHNNNFHISFKSSYPMFLFSELSRLHNCLENEFDIVIILVIPNKLSISIH